MIETEVTFALDDIIENDGNWFREAIREHLYSSPEAQGAYDVDGVVADCGLDYLTFLVSGYTIYEGG